MNYRKECVDRYLGRHGLSAMTPRAALIDMDGTLYDSMRNHTAAWHRLMTELGVRCTREEFYLYEGMTGAMTINRLFKREFNREASPEEVAELYHRKTVYFNELPVVPPMDGAREMLDSMARRGIMRVLVTGSGQRSVIDRLNRDYPGAFDENLRVTAKDVTRGKPHPEPYLVGIAKAGVSPLESIAVENAPLGVKSAATAGAFTVGLTTGPIPREELENAGADIVYGSMREFADDFDSLVDMLSDKC